MNAPFEIRGDVYAEDMQKSLRNLAMLTKKDVNQLVHDRASTMARYLASWTIPVAGMDSGDVQNGLGAESRKMGQARVSKDIGRVYVDTKAMFKALRGKKATSKKGKQYSVSGIVRRLLTEGNNEKAQSVLRRVSSFRSEEIITFDDGRRHKAARNNGRVPNSHRPVIVADSEKLRAYIKAKREKVGFTKAAWNNAGRMANGKNGVNAVWVRKHTDAPAAGRFQIIGAIGEAMLSSRVPWISKKFNEAGAMESFDRSFKKEIVNATQKILEKEQRKK